MSFASENGPNETISILITFLLIGTVIYFMSTGGRSSRQPVAGEHIDVSNGMIYHILSLLLSIFYILLIINENIMTLNLSRFAYLSFIATLIPRKHSSNFEK